MGKVGLHAPVSIPRRPVDVEREDNLPQVRPDPPDPRWGGRRPLSARRGEGGGAWRDPIELDLSLGLTKAATLAQVNRAEMFGLIERKEAASGERTILSDLG